MERVKATLPGLVIEPSILYKKSRHPFLDDFEQIYLPASARTKTVTVRVLDELTGSPLKDVSVYLQMTPDRKVGFHEITDARGECRFVTRASLQSFARVFLLPKDGYWNRTLSNVQFDRSHDVGLKPLASASSSFYDWGHQFAEMKDGLPVNGEGVKIAIIDTGICKDHPGIIPSGGHNCVQNEDTSWWYKDEDGHGTHCAGVVAATIGENGRGIKGFVPRAQVFAYRVFEDGAEGAETFAIMRAIQRAVEDGCDIINMSLGSPRMQSAIRSKTEFAYDHGVLCIAATGNEGNAVNYPAAFESVMGVGAFGKIGVYPENSLHQASESNIRSPDGQYYLANFSNFGSGVDFCAPGVAILSTVPGGDYCAWDGTSMACPQVTGIATLALSAHADVMNAPRDANRVERLIQILKSRSHKLGFGAEYEGAGSLRIPPMLAA